MPPSSPARYEILRHRPSAYWPLNDLTGPAVELKGGEGLSSVGSPNWGRRVIQPGTPKHVELLGSGVYLSAFSDAAQQGHAGASGKLSFLITTVPGAGGNGLTNASMILSKGGGSNYEYDLQVNANGSLQAGFYTLAGSNVAVATSAAGEAKLLRQSVIGASYDRAANLLVLYHQGVEIARSTCSGTTGNGTASFQVGFRQDAAGFHYEGGVGHVAIFGGTVLSAGAHRALANALLRRPRPLPVI